MWAAAGIHIRGLVVGSLGDGELGGIRLIRPQCSAERTAVVPLDHGTVAQIVWLLGESQIQIAESIPPGRRAVVLRHWEDVQHQHECCTRACPQARLWVSEYADVHIIQTA